MMNTVAEALRDSILNEDAWRCVALAARHVKSMGRRTIDQYTLALVIMEWNVEESEIVLAERNVDRMTYQGFCLFRIQTEPSGPSSPAGLLALDEDLVDLILSAAAKDSSGKATFGSVSPGMILSESLRRNSEECLEYAQYDTYSDY